MISPPKNIKKWLPWLFFGLLNFCQPWNKAHFQAFDLKVEAEELPCLATASINFMDAA